MMSKRYVNDKIPHPQKEIREVPIRINVTKLIIIGWKRDLCRGFPFLSKTNNEPHAKTHVGIPSNQLT